MREAALTTGTRQLILDEIIAGKNDQLFCGSLRRLPRGNALAETERQRIR